MADLLKVSEVLTYLRDQVSPIVDTDVVPLIQAHGGFLADPCIKQVYYLSDESDRFYRYRGITSA